MKIIENNIIRDMTAEEVAEYERQQAEAEAHKYDGYSYSDLVVLFIRERYTIDDELAIHRQKDTKADEWEVYNIYCEECKTKAREIIGREETEEKNEVIE